MTAIKPIETFYNGHKFRSRLEARWAYFFDILGVDWNYELEGYELGERLRYLPDFWLPQVNMWAEVKSGNLDPIQMGKCYELARKTGHPCLLLIGVPGDKPYTAVSFKNDDLRIVEYCLTNHDKCVYEEGQFYIPHGDNDRTWMDTAIAANLACKTRFEFGETPQKPSSPIHLAPSGNKNEKEILQKPLSEEGQIQRLIPLLGLSGDGSISYKPPSPDKLNKGTAIYMITVVLRNTENRVKDVLRMRRIFGIASTYQGDDRLALQVYESGRGYLVEFPKFTTGWCPELVSRLNFLSGADHVRVEPVIFE